jgi:phenylpropionate dioxygenase-like ring-hydroxylating dioxygenase large terminal subunit
MREQCGTLKNYWYAAAQAGTVTAKAPTTSVIMETRLVLFRRTTGEVAVLRDRCSHRNQLLSLGQVHGDTIQCPYHGWTFDHQGQCASVPSEGPCGKAFANREVESFPVREKDGLIWVWMGGADFPPDHEPMSMPPINAEGWGSYYMETEFENTVTNCVENFMDVPHTVWAHPGLFRNRKGILIKAAVERTADSVLVTYDSQEDGFGWGDIFFNPKKLPVKHTDLFMMPNNTRVDYDWGEGSSGFIMISTSVPVNPQLTKVYTLISFKCGWAVNWLFKRLFPWYTRQVIEQDVVILTQQGQSLREAPAAFKHTPADTPHLFVEALRHWAEAGGQGDAPKPLTRQIEFWI